MTSQSLSIGVLDYTLRRRYTSHAAGVATGCLNVMLPNNSLPM